MERYFNIFITKLRKKIAMYSAFLIYAVGRIFNFSIDGIVVFKNSKDIYPCYFFTPLSNEGVSLEFFKLKLQGFYLNFSEMKETKLNSILYFKYKFSEVL